MKRQFGCRGADECSGFLARALDEPTSTKVWKHGGDGETRAGARLEKHLAGTGVRLHHDRRMPGV
ncbi:MAG TPA: hypothetical protein VEF89_19665 [Solirubrobacteraceae bacterium]|nr:hypothetical protein [Solirubrobacteraceae bacterium]